MRDKVTLLLAKGGNGDCDTSMQLGMCSGIVIVDDCVGGGGRDSCRP